MVSSQFSRHKVMYVTALALTCVTLSSVGAQPPTPSDEELFKAAEQESDKNARERARRIILKHFPDLTGPKLDGWIDSYESLPPVELEALMRQRKLLPGIIPRPSTPAEFPDLVAAPETPVVPILQAERRQAMENMRHWNSAGYRRWRVCEIPLVSSPDEHSSTLSWEARRDFQSSRVIASDSPFHLAISGDPDLMFRLDGNVLTRLGSFVRMKDGALALKQGKTTRRLVPELTVPADTRSISFGKNGQLTVNDRTINGQHLRLYRVTNLQHLESSNGILFQITESQAKTLEEVSDFRVHSNSLEASNVDRESAMATVRQLELIKELSGDIP